MKKETPKKCSPTQRKHLLARLRTSYIRDRSIPVPAKIKAARKIVDEYDAAISRVEHGRYARHNKLRKEAESKVHFGSADEALAAVEAFERGSDNG